MGIFKRLLGGVAGGGAQGVGELVGKADQIVSRYAPGITGKDQMVKELIELSQSGVEGARAHDAPMASGVRIVDALVNGINRLIRPGVTIGLIGGLWGWWKMPDPESLNPEYWEMLKITMLFWFGGRAIFSDLPKALKYLGGLRGRSD